MATHKNGSALIIVMMFLIVTAILNIGLYNSVYEVSKMQGVDEVKRMKGYYAAVGGGSFAQLLIMDPAKYGLTLPTSVGSCVTKSVKNDFTGKTIAGDLGLTGSEDVTIKITRISSSQKQYTVDSTYSHGAVDDITVSQKMTLIPDTLNDAQPNSWGYEPSLGTETANSGGALTNSFGVSVYAAKGEVIDVTFCGSIRGNASIQNLWSSTDGGGAAPLFTQSLYCGGTYNTDYAHDHGAPVPCTWKPFVIRSLYNVTKSGTFNFTQQFVLTTITVPPIPQTVDGQLWTVRLYGRVVYAKIVSAAIESGVSP